MIDIKTVNSACDNTDSQGIAFIQSKSNIADGFAKVKKDFVLLEVLLACRLDRPVQ